MRDLTKHELGVLRLAETYGDGLDLTGPRVSSAVKLAEASMRDMGALEGSRENLKLTEFGRKILKDKGTP